MVGFVLVPLLFWLVWRRLIQHVAHQMMAASAEQDEVVIDELKAGEVDARTTPQWAVHEADLSTPESIAPRLRHEQIALRMLRQLCLLDLGFGLAYVLLSMLGGFSIEENSAGYVGLVIGLSLMAITVVRYLLFRRQFRAYDLTRSRQRQRVYDRLKRVGVWMLNLASIGSGATVSNLLYVPAILRTIFGLRVRLAVAALFIFVAVVTAFKALASGQTGQMAAGAGLLLAALLHAGGALALALRMRQMPGIQLLVLRVFNIDETSSFTFSGLMAYWRHFGNHYTVVDTSFLRQRSETNSTWTALMCFVLWGALAGASVVVIGGLQKLVGSELSWHWTIPIVVLLALAGAWSFLALGERRLDRRFLRTREQLAARLQRLDQYPRYLDLGFRHEHVLCHDNTWFLAVADFARRADVVLMDLRGYSEQRQGCQREVDFLFDAVPLDRLLFLIDTADDQGLVRDMLLARWQRLRKTSPNLDLAAPVIQIYLARDNDRRDMQGILDRLVLAADTHAPRQRPSATLAELPPRVAVAP